jgi:formylglycine-generating enzyme required for sulfatase activity
MPDPRKLRVFLCHATEDKSLMREMYERLDAEGWIEPWLDEKNILPGLNWDSEVEQAVNIADVVIVCLSRNVFLKNKYVHRDVKFVVNTAFENPRHSVLIIPLKLDDCQIPRHVQNSQYYEFSDIKQREAIYLRLVKSLELKASADPNLFTKDKTAHFVAPSIPSKKPASSSETLKEFSFVEIPSGIFLMGSKVSNTRAMEDEIPQHPCRISYDYWISRFPITNEQYGAYVVANKLSGLLVADWRKRPNEPAVNITWHNAVEYTQWLTKIFSKELESDLIFRLPTEAEWERAARGDFGREWSWGNEDLDQMIEREISYTAVRPPINPDKDDFSGSNEVSEFFSKIFGFNKTEIYQVDGIARPEAEARWRFKSRMDYSELKKKIDSLRAKPEIITEVGAFSPLTDSPYKIADMTGSIVEWTQSLYMPYPYYRLDGREDLSKGEKRVVRGLFSVGKERFSVRAARRFCAQPMEKDLLLGFRIVIAPPIA